MLVLPIKKQWFDMIVSGEKLEEYRNITPYYESRFGNLFEMYPSSYFPTGKDEHQLLLRNGYSSKSPSCVITTSLRIGFGKEEWGAEKGKKYYILQIQKVQLIKLN